MSDTLDPSKLKAAELRAELEARGLDTEGNMPVLVGRLREALQQADDEEETDVKEELGNGYDGSMKIEEIDVKEELVEPKQEPSDTEDRRREKRIVHSWSRSPDSEKQRPEVEEATVEDEPEYDRSAVLSDWCIKREPDTGHEGPPPRAFSANELAERKQEPFKERRGEKRQASSHQGTPRSKRYCHGSTDKHTDDDPDYDKEAVILDWYNRDLSLIIDKETFLSAKPMTSDGFAYVWHGVRARYGFLRGRLFYEVKVDHLAIPLLEGEQHPHGLRCGWSIDDAGMVLGEEPFSYGYGGTAKASTNLKFKDYGQPFGKGDVIGCYLDMDSEPITMSFSVNGRNFGKCYEVSHRSLQGKALFPHILTKNYTFKVNFGSEYPWFQPMARYRFVGQIPLEERVLGSQGPKTRQDSEDGDEENLETVLDQTRKPSTADDRPTSLKSSVQETRKRKNGGNLQRETLMKKVEKCLEREEDDFDIFGRLVASKLRKLNGQQHMLAEKQILEILYNFSLNTSTASSSRSYSPILNENLRETYVQNDSDIPSFSGEGVNRPYYFSL